MRVQVPATIPEVFFASADRYGDRLALSYVAESRFAALTYQELRAQTIAFATALLVLGIGKGDRVLLLSENRPEWVICDLAMACIGAVNVPAHSVLSPEQVSEMVEDAEPRLAIVSGQAMAKRFSKAYQEHMAGSPVISFGEVNKDAGIGETLSFTDLLDEATSRGDLDHIAQVAATITPDDVMSVTFTSGTSGRQKGVVLTHRNLMSNAHAGLAAQPYYPEDRFVSVLPLSHLYERVAGCYCALMSGCSIRYIPNLTALPKALQEQHPTVLIAVPRLFESVKETATRKVQNDPLQRSVFALAFDRRVAGNPVIAPMLDTFVYSRIREFFGGEMRYAIVGGAKLSRSVSEFFSVAGIPLHEGYGMTETSPIISTNSQSDDCVGTVGRVLECVEVRFAEDGELQVRGDAVTVGYLKDEDNEGAFADDGWLKTGDLARLDKDGRLVLTGRKKELLVLATGEKVAPSGIEEALAASPLMIQACVFGDGMKRVCAVVVPEGTAIARRLKKASSDESRVRQLLSQEAKRMTRALATTEQVHSVVIADEPFTQENGLLTATLKMKRNLIAEQYASDIARACS